MEAERSQIQWGLTAIPCEIRRSESRATVSIAVAPARELVSGETVLYLGRQYRLKIELDSSEVGPLTLEQGWLRLGVPGLIEEPHRAGYVRAALVDWYVRRAKIRLPERVGTWAETLGVAVPRVLIREPKMRWGSCHPSGIVRLNWRIVQAPSRVVDYVVAHELCHLIHEGHGRAFWTTLGRAMPDYEMQRARLREMGGAAGLVR